MLLVVLAPLAFGIAVLATPLVGRFLVKRNVTDHPDGYRKLHKRAVPRLGGVVIFFAFMVTVAVELQTLHPSWKAMVASTEIRLLPALITIFAVGVVDDLRGLSPRVKLNLQLCAAALVVAAGIRFGEHANLSLIAVALQAAATMFWIVLCTNAFNLIDGMDGLAAGLGLILAITIAFAGMQANKEDLVFIGVIFAGCLIGFLKHNFYPASIFLGDSGSLTIGFLLSCLAVIWSNQQTTVTGKLAPAVAFAVPLADVLLSVTRRFLAGRSIFSPDRDHIHHRLLRRGLLPRHATLVLYAVATIASLGAILCAFSSVIVSTGVLIVLAIFVVFCFRKLEYVEFSALKFAVRNLSIRSMVKAHITISNFQKALQTCDDVTLFWLAVREACFDFGFDQVRLVSGGQVFEEKLPLTSQENRSSFVFVVNEDHSLTVSGKVFGAQHQSAWSGFFKIVLDELRIHSSSAPHIAIEAGTVTSKGQQAISA